MNDTIGMEMAQANAVVTKKFPQERMHRNPKSTNKISHEYNEFAGIGCREGFTCSGAPSSICLIVKDAFEHHHRFDPLLVLSATSLHSSSGLSSCVSSYPLP